MDRNHLEGAAIFVLFVGICVLGHMLNLRKRSHWFGTGVRGTVKSNRLPFHFGLRTLLIATTLVAVALGLVVYAVRK